MTRYLPFLGVLILVACTVSPDRPKPATDYPDASTPAGISEFNGGILADITVNGRGYNVVTPILADKVQKWQGSRNGFLTITYLGNGCTAIDKGTMFLYDTHGW